MDFENRITVLWKKNYRKTAPKITQYRNTANPYAPLLNNSIVLNAIITHFLWSIRYEIYISYNIHLFKPGRGITKSILVIQRDASKWPGILKLTTMERVLTRGDTSERREWAFSYLNNSIVLNAIITHFLWSIRYEIYTSYLRLLIWGRMAIGLQPLSRN